MKVILLGRKPAAAAALEYLITRGAQVVAVVPPPVSRQAEVFWSPDLRDAADRLGIPVVEEEVLYRDIAELHTGRPTTLDIHGVDLVISFLYWNKIRPELIALPRLGCFNFHPGPLPEFRGRRGYNFAILEDHKEYGGTVHWMDNRFDTGAIVEVRKFPMAPDETALSLEAKTMVCLQEMFRDFIDRIQRGESIPAIPQGPGRSATKQEMLEAMAVSPDDTPEMIARRVRAFWYPPHSGATIEVGGERYTLVDSGTLKTLGAFIHGSRRTPW